MIGLKRQTRPWSPVKVPRKGRRSSKGNRSFSVPDVLFAMRQTAFQIQKDVSALDCRRGQREVRSLCSMVKFHIKG
jgi:hypothetical protein